jgi:septal ring factor EnvC (AmiA/AmiB activator)
MRSAGQVSVDTDEQVIDARFIAMGTPYELSAKTLSVLTHALAQGNVSEALGMCDKLELDFCKFMQMQRAAEDQIIEAERLAEQERNALESVQQEIVQLEQVLEEARNEKKFKDKCDVLASKIAKVCSRSDTEDQIERVEEEIKELEQRISARREHVEAQRLVYESLFEAVARMEQYKGEGEDVVMHEEEEYEEGAIEDEEQNAVDDNSIKS